MNDVADKERLLSKSEMGEISWCIKNYSTFLVTSHIRPDGDAIGSQMAMVSWLRKMSKKVRVINADPTPAQYLFLPGTSLIEINNRNKDENIEIALGLDLGEKARSGGILEAWQPFIKIINIDHHISNTYFGEINWVEPDASSTSELVFRLIEQFPFEIDEEMATNLYTGILTDTGSFRFKNTKALTFSIASKLVERGVDPAVISEAVYDSKSLPEILALGKLINSLHTTRDGSVAWVVVDDILDSCPAVWDDSEWFIDIVRALRETKVVILIKKIKENMFKVSLRSKGKDGEVVNVSDVANKFGGGGHVRAAGCEISGTSEKVLASLLESIREKISYAL